MDMYMKNLKPFIFAAHSELRIEIPSIKKSHLYEALSAFCGFKSYASFKVVSDITVKDLELANRLCFERLLRLGFSEKESLQVCQRIHQVWKQFNTTSLDDVYSFYTDTSCERALSSSQVLDTLTSLIDSNDEEATLLALVIVSQELVSYEENPDIRAGEYWYHKKQNNQTLNNFQSEVADQYQQIVPYKKLLNKILGKSRNSNNMILPSPSILKNINEQFDSDQKKSWSDYFCDEPYVVIEAIGYVLHCHDTDEPIIPLSIYLDWIKAVMLAYPSREVGMDIIEATNSDEEKWFWHFVGLQHDIDVTQPSYRLINRYTGKDWDDDGPAMPVGDDGISLPIISENKKLKIENIAKSVTN